VTLVITVATLNIVGHGCQRDYDGYAYNACLVSTRGKDDLQSVPRASCRCLTNTTPKTAASSLARVRISDQRDHHRHPPWLLWLVSSPSSLVSTVAISGQSGNPSAAACGYLSWPVVDTVKKGW